MLEKSYPYTILPSLLAANSLNLGDEVSSLVNTGKITSVHLDVMDNHYVPNLSFSPEIAERLHERFPNISLDVHLMTRPVDALIMRFAAAGAKRISIHADATPDLAHSLHLIRTQGCLAGLALNPKSDLKVLEAHRQQLDFALIMTVHPGFGGQTFLTEELSTIQTVHLKYPELILCVDGGINQTNIASIAQHGAREFVIGSALFKQPPYAKTLQAFQTILSTVL